MRWHVPVLIVALFACAAPPEALEVDANELEIATALVGAPTQRGGTLRVHAEGPLDTPWTISAPSSAGLTFTETEDRTETIGPRRVRTQTYDFKGNAGQHLLEHVCATSGNATPVCASPLYIDMGIAPDREQLIDIDDPSAVRAAPSWQTLAAVGGLLALMGGGLFVAFRRRPEPIVTAVPPEPADQVAIRRWEAIRADVGLSDYEKTVALSHVFREYVQASLRFGALGWTTTEILTHLRGLAFLRREDVGRAKRLLRATDLVKFADRRPDTDFFEPLDSDLRAFVNNTRPRSNPHEEGP